MSLLSTKTEKLVEELLVSDGLIKADELARLVEEAKKSNTPLISLLVSGNHITDELLTRTIAKASDIPYVNLSQARIGEQVLGLLPLDVAERYMAVPLGEMERRLVVAMLDADNVQAVDFLAKKIGRPLKVYAATESGIRQVLKQYGLNVASDLGRSYAETKPIAANPSPLDNTSGNLEAIVSDLPISKALTSIMEYAAKNRASDIHIEPLEKELKIRCRIDGILREVMKLPKSTEAPIVSRIKILANLKIDEHRIPQDGQFTVNVGGRFIDLRIAIAPLVWGEQVVIRLLDTSGTSFKLEDMGYRGRALRAIRSGLQHPNGMILTSGPTGSGKTTSLYALLQEIKNDTINIVTLEDPVEYKMPGVNQIQVNNEVGLTFATGLRSILRQDPDVVMVGEIRDKETATLAVQAALTGHLVFSTLHTNSAAGILPRLLDMSIEPFLIASTVHTVIGQRLVRKLADNKVAYQSNKAETQAIHNTIGKWLPIDAAAQKAAGEDLGYNNLPLRGQNAYTLYKGVDGPDSPSGFNGRIGLYEVFELTEQVQELILKRSTSNVIQKAVQLEQGMLTMREDGYLKALAGATTLAEVNRVAADDA